MRYQLAKTEPDYLVSLPKSETSCAVKISIEVSRLP